MGFLEMNQLELQNKRVLIRADLNVPLSGDQIRSDARIRAFLPTLEAALAEKAAVMVMSHLGRPTEGTYDEAFSLAPVVRYLEAALNRSIRLEKSYLDGVEVASGEVVVLENVRFNPGEKKNDDMLAKRYANLCDIFVMDAFGTAHRAQASTYGVAECAPIAAGGPLLSAEVQALQAALKSPKRPMIAIVGGAKVSSKLTILENLMECADQVIVGGGISNTFLAASGQEIGGSLYEPELLPIARNLLKKGKISLATDVYVGTEFSENATATLKSAASVEAHEQIMDLGEQTTRQLTEQLKQAQTILWNGPVGVFEFPAFRKGTEAIAKAVAASSAFSIAGGGDTLAAIDLFGIKDQISYISTGGGAFLEFIEGKTLPAIAILEKRAQQASM